MDIGFPLPKPIPFNRCVIRQRISDIRNRCPRLKPQHDARSDSGFQISRDLKPGRVPIAVFWDMADIVPLIEFLMEECDHAGVAVVLHPASKVRMDGVDVSGYYDATRKEIHVAGEHEAWWGVFAHEWGHLKAGPDPVADEARQTFDDWLAGKRVKRSTIDFATRAVQGDEWKAERAAAAVLRRFRVLPANYVQSANAYVMSFEFQRRVRNTFTVSPSGYKPVWSLMPKRLVKPEAFGYIDPMTEIFFAECLRG